MIDLAIIIVHFNTPKLLDECLISIGILNNNNNKVIIVDNNSDNFQYDYFIKKFPSYKFICLDNNIGFSKANNIGIRSVNAKFYLILNPDTKFIDSDINKVLKQFQSSRNVGILGCKLLNIDGTYQKSVSTFPKLTNLLLNFSGLKYFINYSTIKVFSSFLSKIFKKRFIRYRNIITNEIYVDMVWGAFFLVKREVFKKCGLFDEKFFLGGEENEFCYRANKQGYKTLYYPSYSIIHHLGAVIKKSRILSVNSQINGYLHYYKKHFSKNKYRQAIYIIRISLFLRKLLLITGFLKKYTNVQEEIENQKNLRLQIKQRSSEKW